MHPSIGIGILAVFVTLVTVGVWGALRRKANRIAGVRCQTPSDIATAGLAAANEKGLVSTEGAFVPGQTLKSPMSGQDCLYWEVEVIRKWEKETVNSQGEAEKKTGTTSVLTQKQGSLQQITDGLGPSVLVDFTDRPDTEFKDSHSSEVRLGLMVPGELKFGAMRIQTPILPSGEVTKGFIGREKIVLPLSGDQIYVLGKLQKKPEGLMITKPGWSSLVVSATGREATLGKTEQHARVASFVSAAFAFVSLICAIVGLIVGRPATAADNTDASAVETSTGSSKASPCDEAYEGLAEIVRGLQQKMPGGESTMPDRASFLRGCRELPENLQKCLSIGYATEHLDECTKAQQNLDPATVARFKKLMGR